MADNYCRKCGHKLLSTDNYCPGCGCKINNTEGINEQKEINLVEKETTVQEISNTTQEVEVNTNNQKTNNKLKFIKFLYHIPSEDSLELTKLIIYLVFPLSFIFNLYELINHFYIYTHLVVMLIGIIVILIMLSINIYKYHTLTKDAFKFAIAYYAIYFGFQLIFTFIYSNYGFKMSIGGEIIHLIIIVAENKRYKNACLRKNTYYDKKKHLDEIVKMYNPENESSENK